MTPPVRWLRDHPTGADRLLAAAIAVGGIGAHVGAPHHAPHGEVAEPSALGVALCLVASVPLVWRRTHPLQVLVAVTAAQWSLGVMDAAGPGWIGVMVAAYSLGRYHGGRRRVWWIGGACLGSIGAFVIAAAVFGDAPWAPVASTLVIIPAVVVFGDGVSQRRKRVAEMAERAERAERERELLARQHVQDERARIARELHDVVAHSVSVMVIQAGAARRTLESNPARANTALEVIETTGRSAMNEMRRILGVLREEPDDRSGAAVPTAPTPSLPMLADLVRVDPDLPVALDVVGSFDDVPTGVGVDVYRVVQEALTNVRRHAGLVTQVQVRIARHGDRLRVEVLDDGRGASTLLDGSAHGSGRHGLIGMRERVASAGGEFSAGARPGGGWRVLAVFPLPWDPATALVGPAAPVGDDAHAPA